MLTKVVSALKKTYDPVIHLNKYGAFDLARDETLARKGKGYTNWVNDNLPNDHKSLDIRKLNWTRSVLINDELGNNVCLAFYSILVPKDKESNPVPVVDNVVFHKGCEIPEIVAGWSKLITHIMKEAKADNFIIFTGSQTSDTPYTLFKAIKHADFKVKTNDDRNVIQFYTAKRGVNTDKKPIKDLLKYNIEMKWGQKLVNRVHIVYFLNAKHYPEKKERTFKALSLPANRVPLRSLRKGNLWNIAQDQRRSIESRAVAIDKIRLELQEQYDLANAYEQKLISQGNEGKMKMNAITDAQQEDLLKIEEQLKKDELEKRINVRNSRMHEEDDDGVDEVNNNFGGGIKSDEEEDEEDEEDESRDVVRNLASNFESPTKMKKRLRDEDSDNESVSVVTPAVDRDVARYERAGLSPDEISVLLAGKYKDFSPVKRKKKKQPYQKTPPESDYE